MKRSLIATFVIVLLAACNATPAASPTVPSAAMAPPPAATQPLVEPTLPPAPPPPAVPLTGSLLGLYLENSYEDVYLAVYDTGTRQLRQVSGGAPVLYGEAQWTGEGCGLFLQGREIDLQGVTRWHAPAAVTARVGDYADTRLSPGKEWLAHPVADPSGSGRLDLEVIRLREPYEARQVTSGGGVDTRAVVWSADERWVYFSDRDASGNVQIFRAAPDGSATEQLTRHVGPVADVNALALSPDESRLAYAALNLPNPTQPYAYDAADEAWLGIVELATGEETVVAFPKLGAIDSRWGIWWDGLGERLLVTGSSLPVTSDDPLFGRQAHWVAANGAITGSFYQADGPDAQVGWIAPIGGIDRLMFSSFNGQYLYEDETYHPVDAADALPVGASMEDRLIGVFPGPLDFPGEADCLQTSEVSEDLRGFHRVATGKTSPRAAWVSAARPWAAPAWASR